MKQMIRKCCCAALAAVLCLCLTGAALGEATFEGTVVAGPSISVTAPFGGIIQSLDLRAGSVIHTGDVIAQVETTKVYAPSAGTVTGIFAQPGDSLTDVTTRYGATLYITPENKYQVEADIQYAYNSAENKYVNIGETVYLSNEDGKHTAEGTITAASGTSFTVETTSGELMINETVRVFRAADFNGTTRIGKGSVTRAAEVAVDGTGSLLYLHVKDGDTVERGQLLFETVTGALDGLYATGNQIISQVDGIVAALNVSAGSTINKGDAVMTVYPQDTLLLEIQIAEYDLNDIAQGDKVSFTLNYQETEGQTYEGTVSMISYLSQETNGEITYLGYVAFEGSDEIRLGMTAAVTTEK